MTMFAHRLIRIRGDEDWATYGPQWWRHVDAITDLWFVESRSAPRSWINNHARRHLHGGATLVELSRDELPRLINASLAWQREGDARQRELLTTLPDERYSVIWIKDTEPQVGPGVRFTHRPDAHPYVDPAFRRTAVRAAGRG